MARRIRKTFAIFNYDKEEEWLNDMAKKGQVLSGVTPFTYTFSSSEPGEYQVRMQLLDKQQGREKVREYIEFLEDTGIEYIGEMFGWAYFRKRGEGEFQIYSDAAPKIKQINTILVTLSIIFVLNLWLGVTNIYENIMEPFNSKMLIGLLNLAIVCLFAWGIIKLLRKKWELKKENDLFEK